MAHIWMRNYGDTSKIEVIKDGKINEKTKYGIQWYRWIQAQGVNNNQPHYTQKTDYNTGGELRADGLNVRAGSVYVTTTVNQGTNYLQFIQYTTASIGHPASDVWTTDAASSVKILINQPISTKYSNILLDYSLSYHMDCGAYGSTGKTYGQTQISTTFGVSENHWYEDHNINITINIPRKEQTITNPKTNTLLEQYIHSQRNAADGVAVVSSTLNIYNLTLLK